MSTWRHAILEIMEFDNEFPTDGSTPADWVAEPEKYGIPWCDGDIETLVYLDVTLWQFLKWKIVPWIEETKESIVIFFKYHWPNRDSFLIRFGHLEATCSIESGFWRAGSFWTRPVWTDFKDEKLVKMDQMLFDDMWTYEKNLIEETK